MYEYLAVTFPYLFNTFVGSILDLLVTYQSIGDAAVAMLRIFVELFALAIAVIGTFILIKAAAQGREDETIVRITKIVVFFALFAFFIVDLALGLDNSLMIGTMRWLGERILGFRTQDGGEAALFLQHLSFLR